MQLDRKLRSSRIQQFTVVGCGDDLSSPHHGAQAYLKQHGVSKEIPDANIHKIRCMGGIFTGDVFETTEDAKRIVTKNLLKQIGGSIDLKESSIVFICGHNPCMGCSSVGIDVETQKQRLIEFTKRVHQDFDVPAVTLFEEHAQGNHYEVIFEVGDISNSTQMAEAA